MTSFPYAASLQPSYLLLLFIAAALAVVTARPLPEERLANNTVPATTTISSSMDYSAESADSSDESSSNDEESGSLIQLQNSRKKRSNSLHRSKRFMLNPILLRNGNARFQIPKSYDISKMRIPVALLDNSLTPGNGIVDNIFASEVIPTGGDDSDIEQYYRQRFADGPSEQNELAGFSSSQDFEHEGDPNNEMEREVVVVTNNDDDYPESVVPERRASDLTTYYDDADNDINRRYFANENVVEIAPTDDDSYIDSPTASLIQMAEQLADNE